MPDTLPNILPTFMVKGDVNRVALPEEGMCSRKDHRARNCHEAAIHRGSYAMCLNCSPKESFNDDEARNPVISDYLMNERQIILHARAGSDLVKGTAPYAVIKIGGKSVKTRADKTSGGINPVWDEEFSITLPPASASDTNEKIHVTVYGSNRLLPDSKLGTGIIQTTALFSVGHEELKVPIANKSGKPAGAVHIGLRRADAPTVPSSAGTVLGEESKALPASDVAAMGDAKPEIRPSAQVAPATENKGAVVPGGVDDPSKPTYGILSEQ